jgi:hypothetical protein
MTALDRWTENLACPVCGLTGEARLSQEDGYAFRRDQSTRIDYCPEGFEPRTDEKHPTTFLFYCKQDDVAADT